MPRQTRLQIAKKDIHAFFDQGYRRVYTSRQLAEVLHEQRDFWRLAQRTKVDDFVSFLSRTGDLTRLELVSEHYKNLTRYVWGDASPYEVALSIRPSAYISHASAVFLHSLTELIPRVVFINAEQSPKPAPRGELTQAALDRAFARAQRSSRLSYTLPEGMTATVLSGKNTQRAGVVSVTDPNGVILDATSLERTLIDIVVRPAYAGGYSNIIDAYRSARDKLSVNKLRALLRRMEYVYPYHQAIGFLLQRTGYEQHRYQILRTEPFEFDFYLGHAIQDPNYDEHWRLFYPKGLG